MTFVKIENFLANFSFICLFLMMIFYWFQAIFFKESHFQKIGKLGMILSNLSLFFLLALRWFEYSHFPLSNLYESLMFLSWSLTTLHFILENSVKNFYIGSLTTPIALFTNAFATFSLPKEMQLATPLVPALQSNWLIMHVTIMILSYAALLLGSLLAIAFLVLTYDKNFHFELLEKTFKNKPISSEAKQSFVTTVNQNEVILTNSTFFEEFSEKKISFKKKEQLENWYKIAQTLDNFSYRIIGIGFPFLTIGILSGAVWANEAWGAYWSWDPKETWAFMTWLIFAIYLHLRLTKGWTGKKPASIAALGFFIVWICYLGVNLLGKGLHSYGWIEF